MSICLLALLSGTAAAAHGPPTKPGKPGGDGRPANGGSEPHTYSEAHNGFTCRWGSSGAPSVTCGRSDGTGLRVTVSRTLVQVAGPTGPTLFSRAQPRRRRGPARQRGKGVAFTHVQDGLACEWRTADGGGVLCGAADRRGYAAGVLPTVATVLDGAGSIVYLGKQP